MRKYNVGDRVRIRPDAKSIDKIHYEWSGIGIVGAHNGEGDYCYVHFGEYFTLIAETDLLPETPELSELDELRKQIAELTRLVDELKRQSSPCYPVYVYPPVWWNPCPTWTYPPVTTCTSSNTVVIK